MSERLPGDGAEDQEVFEELPELKYVRYERDGPVAVVTIDRQEALNALNEDVLVELSLAFGAAEADVDVKALVVTGAGRAFAAGADIAGINQVEDAFTAREFSLLGQDVCSTLAALPFPTIAAINGFALGGGLELALAADMRVASPQARLGLPEVSLGVIPGYGGTQRLPRIIGLGRALDLILTGRPVGAEEALAMGLANRVVPKGRARAEAEALARTLASFPQTCLREDRRSAYEQHGMALEAALANELEHGLRSLSDPELAAAVGRFVSGAGRGGSFD